MKLPTPHELYFVFMIMCACAISSGLTYMGVRGIYQDVKAAKLKEEREDSISKIMMQKRLQECAYSFGVYVATKGKYGHEFFEKHR